MDGGPGITPENFWCILVHFRDESVTRDGKFHELFPTEIFIANSLKVS